MGAEIMNYDHQNNGRAYSSPDPRAVGETAVAAVHAVKSVPVRFMGQSGKAMASAHEFPPAFVGGLSRSIPPGADLTGRVFEPAQSLSFQSGHHFLHELASGFPSHSSSSLRRGVKP